MKTAISTENQLFALTNAPFGFIAADQKDNIVWVNQTLKSILDEPGHDWTGQSLQEILGGRLKRFTTTPEVWQLIANEPNDDRWFISVTVDLPSGENGYYLVDTTEIIRLRTQVKNLTDQLESSVSKDPLTALLNKRATQQALDNQVSRSRRYNNPLSLIILEVISSKTHNSTVSITMEQSLKAISFYLRDQMRWVDLVGRSEDREFTLILPETKEDDAKRLATKISERLEKLSLPDNPNITLSIRANIGVASWNKGDDASTLIKRAQTTAPSSRAAG